MKKPGPGQGKQTAVARHPHHPKPRSFGGGSGRGPSGAGGGAAPGQKHAGSAKHVTHKHAQHHKKRGLALGDAVACCAAEAVAASLRLTGVCVAEADVLRLYRATSDDPDAGQSILEALSAAQAQGLAGSRPVPCLNDLNNLNNRILGLDLPGGPHAVLATPDGWWSWGALYEPDWPGAVVEEAWDVTWH